MRTCQSLSSLEKTSKTLQKYTKIKMVISKVTASLSQKEVGECSAVKVYLYRLINLSSSLKIFYGIYGVLSAPNLWHTLHWLKKCIVRAPVRVSPEINFIFSKKKKIAVWMFVGYGGFGITSSSDLVSKLSKSEPESCFTNNAWEWRNAKTAEAYKNFHSK